MRPFVYVPNNEAAAASLSEFGSYPHNFPGVTDHRQALDELRLWVSGVRASGSENAVFIDTTMLHTVDRLLMQTDPSGPAPTALLDLASAVSSLILADTIFHLENGHTDSLNLNESLGLGPAFISVPIQSANPAVGALLRGIWLQCMDYVERIGSQDPPATESDHRFAEDGRAVTSAWDDLLGAKLNWSNWQEDAVAFRNRRYGESSDAAEIYRTSAQIVPYNLSSLGDVSTSMRNRVHDFVLESNLRSAFNYAVAYALQVDYVPNVFRMPFQKFLYQNGLAKRQFFLNFVDVKWRENANELFGLSSTLNLPFFLNAILAKATTIEEFRELIGEFRSKAAGFRMRRRELNEAIERGNFPTARRIINALESEDVPSFWKWVLTGTVAISAMLTPAVALQVAQLSTLHALELGAIALPAGLGRDVLINLFKPRMRFLADTAAAAASLGDASAKIESLWGTRPIGQSYKDRLNRAANLGTLQAQ